VSKNPFYSALDTLRLLLRLFLLLPLLLPRPSRLLWLLLLLFAIRFPAFGREIQRTPGRVLFRLSGTTQGRALRAVDRRQEARKRSGTGLSRLGLKARLIVLGRWRSHQSVKVDRAIGKDGPHFERSSQRVDIFA
jgi:hypothetical protein